MKNIIINCQQARGGEQWMRKIKIKFSFKHVRGFQFNFLFLSILFKHSPLPIAVFGYKEKFLRKLNFNFFPRFPQHTLRGLLANR